jgi:predicted DNA-binding transcriptional regulator AlpA
VIVQERTTTTEKPLVTREELLDILPVNSSTLWRWIRAGRFPAPISTPGKVFWSRVVFEQWMRGQR